MGILQIATVTKSKFENYHAGTNAGFPAKHFGRTIKSDQEKGRRLSLFECVTIYGSNFFIPLLHCIVSISSVFRKYGILLNKSGEDCHLIQTQNV